MRYPDAIYLSERRAGGGYPTGIVGTDWDERKIYPDSVEYRRVRIPVFHWKVRNYEIGPQLWSLFAGHVRVGSVCLEMSGGFYAGLLLMSDIKVRAGTLEGCRDELERAAGVWFESALREPPVPRTAPNTVLDGSDPPNKVLGGSDRPNKPEKQNETKETT